MSNEQGFQGTLKRKGSQTRIALLTGIARARARVVRVRYSTSQLTRRM